jgi:lipoyl(octanoyl) transferase
MEPTPNPHRPTPTAVLPYAEADGPANMALDEALLEAVAADPSAGAFRLYGWSVPTLSLGYFQAVADAEREPRWRDVPLVRRPTGGGAIWHDRELTYALVVPRDHPLARRPVDLYRVVHQAILEVLRGLGAGATLRGGGVEGRSRPTRPFLCFTDRDPEDIVFQGMKIVGSAQRRRLGVVLQHGSILLSRSPRTPELPGLQDLLDDVPASAPPLADLRDAILAALGWTAQPRNLTAAERQRASELERHVYRGRAWTRRR